MDDRSLHDDDFDYNEVRGSDRGGTAAVRSTGAGATGDDASAPSSRGGDDATGGAPPPEHAFASYPNGYNPRDFDTLAAEPALKALFGLIEQYRPVRRKIAAELKPFIPDYIPAIGDVDEFLKPPRPDGEPERLGLRVLDEPTATPSDPAILRRLLRARTTGTAALSDGDEPASGAILAGDSERGVKIDAWIASVARLREDEEVGQFKPRGHFPPHDALMQTWPEELEPFARALVEDPGDANIDMLTLTRSVCSVLDIPVRDDPIESLYWLFTLFLELKHNALINPAGELALAGAQDGVNVATFS